MQKNKSCFSHLSLRVPRPAIALISRTVNVGHHLKKKIILVGSVSSHMAFENQHCLICVKKTMCKNQSRLGSVIIGNWQLLIGLESVIIWKCPKCLRPTGYPNNYLSNAKSDDTYTGVEDEIKVYNDLISRLHCIESYQFDCYLVYTGCVGIRAQLAIFSIAPWKYMQLLWN